MLYVVDWCTRTDRTHSACYSQVARSIDSVRIEHCFYSSIVLVFSTILNKNCFNSSLAKQTCTKLH